MPGLNRPDLTYFAPRIFSFLGTTAAGRAEQPQLSKHFFSEVRQSEQFLVAHAPQLTQRLDGMMKMANPRFPPMDICIAENEHV
jgi:hypothetical protein